MPDKARHIVRFEPVGVEMDVEEGEWVLDAAFRQGIAVMHGCKEGQCGSCKCRLIDGDVEMDKYSTFALPDFGPGATFPGAVAMDFHFIDYVVHGWDVAATLGAPYALPDDVVAAALPLAMFVPDGDYRAIDGAPFGPAVEAAGTDDFERILRHLGRRPDWASTGARIA